MKPRRWLKLVDEKPSWRELPIAALVLEPGNMVEARTGEWRMGLKPSIDGSRCRRCYVCWALCPDASIIIGGDGSFSVDYAHCKGCGICARVCPYKAVEMVEERWLSG
jgi:pyruvate ferredoxin oxidoreductase delta subunit